VLVRTKDRGGSSEADGKVVSTAGEDAGGKTWREALHGRGNSVSGMADLVFV
jgi:hypothetical protein